MPIVISGTNGISGVDGTASNPSYEGTDSNTGIFFPAADTVAIGTNGTEALRVNSSQNVGIGITSPSYRVHANQNSAGGTTYGLVTSNNAGGSGTNIAGVGFSDGGSLKASITAAIYGNDYMAFNIGGSGTTERMRLDASGRLLLGATSGSAILTVVGGTQMIHTFTGASAAFVWGQFDSSGNASINNQANANLLFATNNAERGRITSGGYFKASDNGTYANSTGAYHEFYQTANSIGLANTATNASYGNEVIRTLATRSQTSAYTFFTGWSNNGNDLEFNLRGDGNGFADGSWFNNGADYAEFFESANGQALTLGATVVLDNNKVREATSQDPASAIMGVVRPKEPNKASMVVGNTAWNKWANKYLTDDFDRYIMEDHNVLEWTDEEGKQHSYESHNIPDGVTVPDDAVVKTHDDKGNKFQHYKLNPAWDKDAEYTPREQRPEWNIIGLIGQVKVLKGQPVNDRWIKMRDVSDTVEEWFIR
jgi:hypothetical protein